MRRDVGQARHSLFSCRVMLQQHTLLMKVGLQLVIHIIKLLLHVLNLLRILLKLLL